MREALLKLAATGVLGGALGVTTAATNAARAPDLILAHGTVLTVDTIGLRRAGGRGA